MSARHHHHHRTTTFPLRDLQVEILAQSYPSFAANQKAILHQKSVAHRIGGAGDFERVERVEKHLFSKYRRQAERDGYLDRSGRPVYHNHAVAAAFNRAAA